MNEVEQGNGCRKCHCQWLRNLKLPTLAVMQRCFFNSLQHDPILVLYVYIAKCNLKLST